MNSNRDVQLFTELCSGCGACADKCPVSAIAMKEDSHGSRGPFVDTNLCITCKQCTKVCPQYSPLSYLSYEKKSYVGYIKNKILSEKSASGGIFALIAQYILQNKGVVYGAAIINVDGEVQCRHIRIDNENDLHLIQGSKYVQSRTDGIFVQVKDDLHAGKTVLFSGTSCQVASLKNFVGHSDNLYTIDLVCHGVPKDKVFYDYIHYVEKKYRGKVTDISFRSKKMKYRGKIMPYVLTIQMKNGEKGSLVTSILRPYSVFYSLFMSRAGYRESCYHCQYASLQKPGDLTLGDFRPSDNEIQHYSFHSNEIYSSVFVHSENGNNLLNAIYGDIDLTQFPMNEMLKHHLNMQHSSVMSQKGERYYKVYLFGGFTLLQNYLKVSAVISQIKRKIKSIIK